MIHGRHLQADDAAADDEQALGDAVHLERARRVDDARVVVRDERQHDGLGARGDDRLVERDERPGAAVLDLELVCGDEPADARDDRHLARLGEAREAADELLDDAVLPAAQLVDVDLRRPEADAVRAHLVRLVDHLGGVQQRLRRDAADVEADAAEHRPALDQHHLLAEVGGAKRGRVAAGPGAEHEHLGVVIGLARHAGRAVGAAAACRLWRRRRLRPCLPVCSMRMRLPSETRSPGLIADRADGARRRRRHVHRRLVRIPA